jgi:hypothetical protein
LARRDPPECQGAHSYPRQLLDRVADRGTQSTHEMRPAFGDTDLQPRLRWQRLQHPDRCRRREASVKPDAAFEPSQLTCLGTACDLCLIGALDPVAWVHQSVSERAIVGQQKQPGRCQVEAADREYAGGPSRQQVADRVPPLRVLEGRDHAARLV